MLLAEHGNQTKIQRSGYKVLARPPFWLSWLLGLQEIRIPHTRPGPSSILAPSLIVTAYTLRLFTLFTLVKMKFSAVLGAILGASAVAAAPGTAKRRERAARLIAERQARKGGLMVPDINETDELAVVNGTKHASYSQNVRLHLFRVPRLLAGRD